MSRTVRKAADRLAIATLGCSRDERPGPPLHVQDRRGTVRYVLLGTPGGLYVERDESPHDGVRTVQSLVFSDPAAFQRWCDDDPILCEHPLLRERLQRTGLDRWGTDP